MDKILNNQFIKLDSPRAWRTYIGGRKLDQIHGIDSSNDSHFPEEWIMSMTVARNTGREEFKDEGMSHLVDYSNLAFKDLILSDPSYYLGDSFYSKYGSTTGVLVKLIDASERLTVQVHPTKEKARLLFNSNYGKTECWYVLDDKEVNRIKPCIYIGFKKGITKEIWKDLFDKQDIQGMLSWMHKIPVKKGETILIKGGLPHAIGQYCFLVEIQEPTDYTIRIERTTPAGFKISDFMCHQGIGFDRMFDCFNYIGMSEQEIRDNYFVKPIEKYNDKNNSITTLIGYETTDLFKLDRIDVQNEINIESSSSFGGIYVLEGEGTIINANSTFEIKKGNQFFLPCKLGNWKIINKNSNKKLTVLYFKGPKD